MNSKLIQGLALIALLFPVEIYAQTVNIKLTVFKYNGNTEVQAKNVKVYIRPHEGLMDVAETDANGVAVFPINSTSSFTLSVGDPPGNVALSPMSGRFSQNTSYVILNKVFACAAVANAEDSQKSCEFTAYSNFLTDVLDSKYNGNGVSAKLLQNVTQISRAIDEHYKIQDFDTPESKAAKNSEKTELKKMINDITAPPWRLGIEYKGNDARGAIVSEVAANSPAANSGLRRGDLITECNQVSLAVGRNGRRSSLANLVANAKDGKIVLSVIRSVNNQEAAFSLEIQLER